MINLYKKKKNYYDHLENLKNPKDDNKNEKNIELQTRDTIYKKV